MALMNLSVEEESYRREYEEFLKRILSLPVSWEKDRKNYRLFLGDLLELLVREDRREEADHLAEQWRKQKIPVRFIRKKEFSGASSAAAILKSGRRQRR
ncbi:MAG: hypothetical protein IKE16_00380, partial [Solobacterium sp.]|nr:hypothetical protein [Solobacterium sp.]